MSPVFTSPRPVTRSACEDHKAGGYRGKVTATFGEAPNSTTYSGHATVWGNFNQNQKNANNSFTLTIRVFAPDGSSIVGHEVSHFALNAGGVITVNFDKLSFTCT